MKNITCATIILGRNNEYKEHAYKVVRYFERLNNTKVMVFEDKALEGRLVLEPAFARYHLWDLVPGDVDRLMYMDVDMLPLRPLPEPPDADFCAAPDQAEVSTKLADMSPVIKRAGIYYNAGMFIAKRTTAQLFKRMATLQSPLLARSWPWYFDQTQLNIELQLAVERGELKAVALPKQWNNLAIDPEFVSNPYMIHFAAWDGNKMRTCRAVVDTFERIEEAAREQTNS
jgi:hypothetical protein